MDERLLKAFKTLKDSQDSLKDNQDGFKKSLDIILKQLESIDDYKENQKGLEDSFKKLQESLQDIDKSKVNKDKIYEDIKDLKNTVDNIIKEQEKKDNFNLQKLMVSVSADLERYSIIDGEWCYNGRPVGVRAEAKDGKPGKDGKDGKDGKTGPAGLPGPQGLPGRDGETPILKMGKITDSEEHGGASAKFRKSKKEENIYYLDLVLPRGPQGFMGFDAKINGKNAIEILAGNNISVTQDGKKVYINSLVNPFELKILQELPTENISSSAIYFTPSPDPKEKNIFIESVYVNKGTEEEPLWDWEEIGSTKIDLSGYVQKSSFQLVENEDGETGLSITWEV